ncbi:DNA-directed RNA polymerase V subunit 1 isoform X1 [Arachis stenosperma]|uniref:DNA-directed RNA polymerase V subunit 1 isoform X1 n=1 Tax=Arachis stenosperma TaxID=217475 RepID=UPI0025ACC13D|nr:DNA-directed RNA polymerase V subunit 1 isoform X1 [Arachis stenosperma]
MEAVEDAPPSNVSEGEIAGIRFAMASRKEICTASISDSSISHASQLSNPFLGLPLEFGRCESCGTSEAGKCEGHFGYIELPVPIFHPSHVIELKRMLSLICLNCLKLKKTKFPGSSSVLAQRLLSSSCCPDVNAAQVSIREIKTDGAYVLVLKVPKNKMRTGFWSFLHKYGYRYEIDNTRALLPCEVMEMIKRFSPETKKKLAGKGYFPQDGYVLKYLPVPPNCLSVPVVSDGVSVMSSDPSITILRKLLRKVEIIRGSRSGEPNFESHLVEANELQSLFDQYLQVRGTSKPARDIETHYGVNKELNDSSTKAWLEKMRTLFIRKGSGFSSRNVITGDGYKRINEIGIPLEVAQRITFEERVSMHNMRYLQKLVDENLCLTYKEGMSTYSLREGSKGHIYLKPGQIVHRRIMDGDIVFINRPPTTHKHSLQALAVYIHNDHTVKINPLICGPLGADFDGDCVHLFYPQSLAAKAEVLELFSVEKQLLSSHSGNLNLQLTSDSLLSLKTLMKKCFLNRATAHQLAMFLSVPLPPPALLERRSRNSYWSAMQLLQCALPPSFDCTGGRYLIRQSEILEFDLSRDILPTTINEIAASIFFGKGPKEALSFFDLIQPLLMESIFAEGFSFGLQDFSVSRAAKRGINRNIGKVSSLLGQLRSIYNELVAQQVERHIQDLERPVINSALKSSKLGDLIDSKSRGAIDKVVQQIGFLGQQLFERGRFYSKGLIEDIAVHFRLKCCYDEDSYPSAEYGLLKGCFFHGLDPYEELVHSVSTREIIVRSSRGLSEPGTLFKNLMAILRDVMICYDGTVRNVCSNSIIQFDYGKQAGDVTQHLFPAGEPVGVLAATSMSNPAYKAVLDASPSSNSSWELMKEILLCKVNFRNEPNDRRVILYLNDCGCGKTYCRENAAYSVKNQLGKVSLKDAAVEFIIEYQQQRRHRESSEIGAGLIGHIHLNEIMLKKLKINSEEIFQRCQDRVMSFYKKKKVSSIFKRIALDVSSECCSCSHSSAPCVMFLWQDDDMNELNVTANILSDTVYPALLETIIKGDPRIRSANIIWVNSDTNTWVRNPCKSPNGELALDISLEKAAVKQSGDAWRIVIDSCLPVIHLIDTRRSIPYAIKQIQELFGISCTFDQAIQRLASSVKMVAKGVLREHLVLLASSMTCGGNLVGFNTGGYKALARQLNIQVPFTDATLFTPRKCFERAAEKCHTDSLSSIVASCSWGKHVAVGTGSRFDILWNANEINSKEIRGMDVYNFLHMVKSVNGEEENNACLGEDIDDLLDEDDVDFAVSPQHNSGFEAVFEENCELLNGSTANGWDTDQNEAKSNDWSAWGGGNIAETKGGASKDWDASIGESKEKSNDWSAWGGGNIAETKDGASKAWDSSIGEAKEKANDWSACGGGNKAETKDGASKAWGASTGEAKEKSNDWSAWAGNKSVIHDGGSERAPKDSWRPQKLMSDVNQEDYTKPSSWDANTDREITPSNNWSAWGGSKSGTQDGGFEKAPEGSWNQKLKSVQKDFPNSSAWNAKQDEKQSNDWSSRRSQDGGFERAQEDTWNANTEPARTKSHDWSNRGHNKSQFQDDSQKSGAWGAKPDQTRSSDRSNWRQNKSQVQDDSQTSSAWGSRPNQTKTSWGQDKSQAQDDSQTSSAWGSRPNQTKTSWGQDKSQAQDDSPNSSAWRVKPDETMTSDWSCLGQNKSQAQNDNQKLSAWGAKPDQTKGSDWSNWGQNKSQAQEDSWKSEKSGAWDMNADQPKASSNDWQARAGNKSQMQDGGSEGAQENSWGTRKWKAEDKVRAAVIQNDTSRSGGWDTKANPSKPRSNEWSSWGSNNNKGEPKVGDDGIPVESNAWAHKSENVNVNQSKEIESNWDAKKPVDNSSWGRPKSQEDRPWNTQNESNQAASSQGWESQIASANADSDKSFQWGKRGRESFKKNRFEGSQGWGSNAGDRQNKSRPPRTPGSRLDIYTSEEQEVLKDIEPIMQSIRRIMQQEGYNDGDPLAADDQTFILENVFEHHPDKENKMGAGIEHVMIDKHSVYQESKCFYVVLKDGEKRDFSYRKCLGNFLKKKYPDVAESFVGKYFRKPRPRGDQASTPGLSEQTTTAGLSEQAAAPGLLGPAPTPGSSEQAPNPGLAETN